MQPLDLLLWAVRALSLFNTIAFLWLALAVLLNAQRRVAGTWITGGGLLLAAIFFTVHSTLVGKEPGISETGLAFLWRPAWLLFLGPPYMWYVVIRWYTGALDTHSHRVWLSCTVLLGLAALALLVVPGLLPGHDLATERGPASLIFLGEVPAAALLYPGYAALCYALALWALRQPGAFTRFMGDLGRQRARPWLIAASMALLGVSLSSGVAAARLLDGIQAGWLDPSSLDSLTQFLEIDLGISALLALVVVLLGKAIVSYEIFTGKVLPRRGLLRHWRNSLILAGGCGVLLGGSLGLPLDPIYPLILAALLITAFYALLSWRSYVERERGIGRLRPFVASQRLYEHMLKPAAPVDVDVEAPFRALCEEVLGARAAHMVALGPMAPLAGRLPTYPPGASASLPDLSSLASRVSPNVMVVPLDPSHHGDALWAVPLWSERGLIGALLLGEKRYGGLYVQEEIEIARSTCERLLDVRATAEMARRLMALQRQRVAESQLIDQAARRELHDDVLPMLHTALLTLNGTESGGSGATGEVAKMLMDVHHRISKLLRSMPSAQAPEVVRLGVIAALRQSVEGDLRSAFDGVTWRVEPKAEQAALTLPPLVAEAVYSAAREAVRNAARHGRGSDTTRPLKLSISVAYDGQLRITIEDDGVGLPAAGASSGRSGQGLALHGTMMAVVGGTLAIEGLPGAGTKVSLALPRELWG